MRALVAGWIGSTNLGDELVFKGLCRHLDDLGIEPVAVSVAPSETAAVHGVDAIRHAGPVDTPSLAWRARGLDAVVFGGGGLIQDQTSPWNVPFHLARLSAGRRRRTPWAGVGLGIDELQSRLSRMQARWSLRGAVGVTVRDEASAQAARQIGLQTVVAADLALALDPPVSASVDRLVVALRPPTRSGFGTAAAKAAAQPDGGFVSWLAASLDKLASDHGLDVRFVAFQRDRDRAVHERVTAAMTAPSTLVEPDLDTILDELASSRLVVTMRYHGAVGALLASRPAVLIDYSQKMANLSHELGKAYPTIAPAVGDDGALSVAAVSAIERTGTLAGHLERLRGRERANRRLLERLADAAR